MGEKKIQKRTIESKEKIEKAAWKLFCEKGYFNTNTKEITKEAGISVGNFYNYYKDKFEVYYALTEKFLDESSKVIIELGEKIRDDKNRKSAFKQYFRENIRRSIEAGRFFSDCEVLVHDETRLNELFDHSRENIIQVIEEQLQSQPNGNRRASVSVMARMLYTIIDKTITDISTISDIAFSEEYIEQLLWVVTEYLWGKDELK